MNKKSNEKILFIIPESFHEENKNGLNKILYNIFLNFKEMDFLSICSDESIDDSIRIKTIFNGPLKFKNSTNHSKLKRVLSLYPIPTIKQKVSKQISNFIIENENIYNSFVFCGPQVALLVSKLPKKIKNKSTLILIDSLPLYWNRRYLNEKNILLKFLFFLEYRKYIFFEKFLCSKFKNITYVSKNDINFSFKNYSLDNHIYYVPNGVSFLNYSPKINFNSYNLLFVGNFDYGPNKEAAHFLINELMPKLHQVNPKYKLTLIGKYLDIVPTVKNIEYLGYVDNIEKAYDEHTVFLSPIFFGSGIKNKILEALSKGLIVIGTDYSFDSIDIQNNFNAIIINTKNISTWIEALELISKSQLDITSMSTEAQKAINSQYNWKSITEKYIDIFQNT